MRLNNVEALFNISNELLSAFKGVTNKRQAYNCLINTDLKDISNDDFELDLKFLEYLNSVLNTLLNICNNHYRLTKDSEIVLRSSLVSTFDNQSFSKTIKDSKLWKQKQSKMTPEYAYSYELVDNLNTYENKVVITCLKRIELIIKNYDYYYDNKILTLNNTASKEDFTYSSMFYRQNKALVDNLLTTKQTSFFQINEYIKKIKQKIRKIKNTPFFIALKDVKPVNGNIILTNIFKDNINYNKVYRFYNKTKNVSDLQACQNSLTNYTYFLIIKSLEKLGYEYINNYPASKYRLINKDSLISDELTFNFKNENFTINLSYLNSSKAFLVEVISNANPFDQSKTLLIPYYTLNINDEINLDINKLNNIETYNNIIIFGYEFIKKYENNDFKTIKISSAQKDYEIIEVFLNSLTYTITALQDIYENMCPVCGEHEIINNDNEYVCLHCRNKYSFIKPKTIWLKSIL